MRLFPRHLPPAATPLTWGQWWSGWGPENNSDAQLSQAVADYLDIPAAFLASSGRTALFMLLRSLKDSENGQQRTEVLLPAYTCPALVRVICDLALKPVPVDIIADTMDYDLELFEGALTERTLAIIHVHPFGVPLAVDHYLELSHAVGAVVIEDAAQSLGACYRQRRVGSWGDFGLFSLGPGKSLSTGGGGIVTANHAHTKSLLSEAWQTLPTPTRTQDISAQLRLAIFSAAFRPAAWWLATKLRVHEYGDDEASWGYQESRLSRAQASVGGKLLEQLDEINDRRRRRAQSILEQLPQTGLLQATSLPMGSEPTYLRLPLLAVDHERRERLYAAFWRAGIGAGKMYKQPLNELFPDLSNLSFPGAQELANRLLTLPTHHFLRDNDISRIATILHEEADK